MTKKNASDLKTKSGQRSLPDKEYKIRNSPLTDLLKVKDFRAIYHIFMVMLIILFSKTLVFDYYTDGKLHLGIATIRAGFKQLPLALLVWCGMQIQSYSLYGLVFLWSKIFVSLNGTSVKKTWNNVSLLMFLGFQTVPAFYVCKFCLNHHFGIATSFAVVLELLRLIMKHHAFVRTVIPRFLVPHQKDNHPRMQSFGKYFYYLFAPTMLYRDEYPRTNEINWNFVIARFAEVIAFVFYLAFIFERFLQPYFSRFGIDPLDQQQLTMDLIGFMAPSMIIFAGTNYCLLHAWLNAFAEMLRFGDREFYKDWWNSQSFSMFYRNWNVVIHDWLYAFVYKDMYDHYFNRNKTAAAITVFLVSAIVHEIALSVVLGYVYPVMFTFFAAGVIVMFVLKEKFLGIGNMLIWLMLFIGNGLMICLYTIESYARINCQIPMDSLKDFLIPASWRCY